MRLSLFALLLGTVSAQICDITVTCGDIRSMQQTQCCGFGPDTNITLALAIQESINACEEAYLFTCASSFNTFWDFITPVGGFIAFYYNFPVPSDLLAIVSPDCIPTDIVKFYMPRTMDLSALTPELYTYVLAWQSAYTPPSSSTTDPIQPIYDSYMDPLYLGVDETYCNIDQITCFQHIIAPGNWWLVDRFVHYPCTQSTPWGVPWLDLAEIGVPFCNIYGQRYIFGNDVVSLVLPLVFNSSFYTYVDWSVLPNFVNLKQIVFVQESADYNYPPPHPGTAQWDNIVAERSYATPSFEQISAVLYSSATRLTFFDVAINSADIQTMVSNRNSVHLEWLFAFYTPFSDILFILQNTAATTSVVSVLNIYGASNGAFGPIDFVNSIPVQVQHIFFTDEYNSDALSATNALNIARNTHLKTFYAANVSFGNIETLNICNTSVSLTRLTIRETFNATATLTPSTFVHCPAFRVLDLSYTGFSTANATQLPLIIAQHGTLDLSGSPGLSLNVTSIIFQGPPLLVSLAGLTNVVGKFSQYVCASGVQLNLIGVPTSTNPSIGVCVPTGLAYYNGDCSALPRC